MFNPFTTEARFYVVNATWKRASVVKGLNTQFTPNDSDLTNKPD